MKFSTVTLKAEWKKLCQILSCINGFMRFITLQPQIAKNWLILSSKSLSWPLITKTSTKEFWEMFGFIVEGLRKISLFSLIVFDCLLHCTDQLIMKTRRMRQAIICRLQTRRIPILSIEDVDTGEYFQKHFSYEIMFWIDSSANKSIILICFWNAPGDVWIKHVDGKWRGFVRSCGGQIIDQGGWDSGGSLSQPWTPDMVTSKQ